MRRLRARVKPLTPVGLGGHTAPMTLADVRGQARAVDRLRAALQRGTVHHAYLFLGPEGVGKALTARAFAMALLCPERPNEGCGVCSTCARIERGTHPDVLTTMPEAERVERGLAARSDFSHTPSREVKVEQIRGLQERLSLHALEAKRKVALLLFAERLNDQAQNAFLKTLEEPPPDTTLVLVCTSSQKLLPTIRSRCAQVPFGPLPRALIAERVAQEKALDPQTAALVAELSEGSLGRALELDTDSLASRQEVVTRFEALDPKDARTLLGFAETFGGSREQAEGALSLLGLWVRDVLALKGGRTQVGQPELAALAAASAARRSELELLRTRQWIEKTRHVIGERNGSPRLQLERMVIALAEGA